MYFNENSEEIPDAPWCWNIYHYLPTFTQKIARRHVGKTRFCTTFRFASGNGSMDSMTKIADQPISIILAISPKAMLPGSIL